MNISNHFRRYAILGFVLLGSVSLLFAQGGAKETEAQGVQKQESPLKTQTEKLSYALGMSFGASLRRQATEVDETALSMGIKDAIAGDRRQISDDELRTLLTDLQEELRAKAVLSAKELATNNEKTGEQFLQENKTKEGVVTLPSGLQYKVLKQGEGPKPQATDTVICNYRGTFVDGREFDSSYKRHKPASFAVNGVIKGWTEALQMMPVGSKWEIFVPPQLAYGRVGAPPIIGPNATLNFELELLSIKDATATTQANEQEGKRDQASVPAKAATPSAASRAKPAEFKISFKLDPLLSGPTYGGERWIYSLPFKSAAQGGKEATVEAKAEGRGDAGAPVNLIAEWKPADPSMMTITPGKNNQVRITVHHAGESKLTIAADGVSKELLVKAKDLGNATQVEISQ